MEKTYDVTTLLTVKQLAGRLRISIRTVWRRVKAGELPAPLYPWNRTPRWPGDAVERAAHVTA
jgi:predicted DNA-binding transcriptional regulator AlpA